MDDNNDARPMNVSPEKWEQMKLRRGSIPASTTVSAAVTSGVEGSPVVLLDQAIDNMVIGAKSMTEALVGLRKQKLSLEEQAAVARMQDLLDTAIAPYLSDVITAAEVFEAPEGSE